MQNISQKLHELIYTRFKPTDITYRLQVIAIQLSTNN